MTPLGEPGIRRLAIFSHPNHELAVLGFVQRLRPHLLFLTDGGGAQRVAESRRGLEAVGVSDLARFLDHPEASFYTALLRGDVERCDHVASEIRAAMDAVEPQQVFCDAVEFYNPVHDLSLPLVLRALGGRRAVSIYEIPLIYQRPGPHEMYGVQRLPESLQSTQVEFDLAAHEAATKVRVRDEIYHQLRNQLGGLLELSTAHAAREVFRPFANKATEPDESRVLRYEWRGRLLQQRGQVAEVITYADHYRPLADALTSGLTYAPA